MIQIKTLIGNMIQQLQDIDNDKLFPCLNENLLDNNGTIAILSCYALETYLDTQELGVDVNLKNSLSYYDQYYATVEGYFECDRNNLQSGYQQYDFKKYFNIAENRIQLILMKELYLKSISN